ncbi:Tyrosine-protein kinase Fer [Taenia crassiceps]|uniref:non-specific protein-tyrosine kinase n=1 Tax=Taenia crassiceps TaxID=6207 RepID=A0ABR4QBZ1_9CEST
MMPFDKGIRNNSVTCSAAENGQTKTGSFTHSPPAVAINGLKCVADSATNIPSSSAPSTSTRLGSQQTGFISFFSTRQRKSSGLPPLSLVSVKQSRLMCVAKIDESVQAIDDLLDFYTRVVKAENKVSNALWHTVQHSKSRKFEGNGRIATQSNLNGSQPNILNPLSRAGASSSGDNSVVDSGISEMTIETSPFSRTNGFQSSSAPQAKQLLQCFIDANETRAEIAACRASFHKKITTFQLQMVSDALQRLRSLYIELDTKLETYSSQLEADVRECWKKYAKYADSVTRLRSRLNLLLEKGMASKRKAIESSVNELDEVTFKLHMAHNTYTLSLITARQYHQWLVTRLQPCLYRNLSRCLRLVDYAVSYLLRLARIDQASRGNFDFVAPLDSDPLGDTSLDTGLTEGMGAPGEDTFRRAFPFDSDLLVRAGDEALQPDKIIVNQMTVYPVQKLLQNHLQEVANQGSITQVLENEHTKLVSSVSTWISVLSSAGPIFRDLPTALKTDEAMARLLDEVEALNPLEAPPRVDEDKVFLSAATKPATICALAIQLGTCEFIHCQSVCFADSHAQIVRVLRQAEVVAPSPPPSLPQPTTLSTTSSSTLLSAAATTSSINSALAADVTGGGASGVGATGLDILESRFHCLRVQLDNQDGSISVGGRSSLGESDSENDGFGQHQAETAGLSSTSPSTPAGATLAPQCRSIKAIREDSHRQTLAAFPKSPFTFTDTRSTNRHSTIVGGKALHRFQQNRIFKKDPSTVASASSLVTPNTLLRSRTNSASPVDQDQSGGALSSISVESIRQINGGDESDPSHRVDQDDVDINKEPWFHGVLPRTEVVRLLQNQGDFLVRETSKAASTSYLARRNRGQHHRQRGSEGPSLSNLWSSTTGSVSVCAASSSSTVTLLGSQSTEDLCGDRSGGSGSGGKVVVTKMVLSVYWNGHKHFIIQGGDEAVEDSGDLGNRRGGWSFEDYEFPTLRDLIEYHMRTGKPVTQSSGAILLNPISRPDWQLDNNDVILLEKIGQGNFGEVHRGIYNGREVAVKTCRAGPAEVEIRRKFLQGEATALNFFHPNVVRLLGIAVRSHPIMIVMEYVAGGSLLSFLRRNGQNAETRLLLRMCVDAANGMAYLESKNCIHRDLAARNCLLTEDRVLKIADFGMAREEHVYEPGQSAEEGERKRHKKSKKLSDRNGPIPIKWTAPEALYSNRYTSKCDVWSFGILLWEIFSAGDTPYHGLTNSETRDLVENGYRLTTPDRMPRQLGKHMQACWHQNPNRRPTFASLVVTLTQLKRDLCDGTDLSSPGESNSSTITSVAAAATTGILAFQQHQQLAKVSTLEQDRLRSRPPLLAVTSPTEVRAPPTSMSPSASTSTSVVTSRLPRLKPVTATSEEAPDDVDEMEKHSPIAGSKSDEERF